MDFKIPKIPNSISSDLIPDLLHASASRASKYILLEIPKLWCNNSHGTVVNDTYLNSQEICLPLYWTWSPTPSNFSAERNTSGWGHEESKHSSCKSNSFRHLQPIFRSGLAKEVSHLPRQGDQILPELSLLRFPTQPSTISIKRQVSRRADFLFGCWK